MEQRICGITFSEEEFPRLVLLRSLEWEALPIFATRSLAPIGLFWLTWWQLLLLLVLPSLLWCPIRTRFVSLRLAMLSSFLNMLYVSVFANILVAIIFFSTGKIAAGFIALFWHFISSALAFAYPATSHATIQEKFFAQIQERSA
jgi:hypothetical protein